MMMMMMMMMMMDAIQTSSAQDKPNNCCPMKCCRISMDDVDWPELLYATLDRIDYLA